jgi:hypothetical protein
VGYHSISRRFISMANYTKREERAAEMKASIARSRAIENSPRQCSKPGPPPTLGQEMRKGYGWFWFWCPRCDHRSPMTLASFAIRYGMDVPTIDVAKFVTCSKRHHAGALLQRPSVIGVAGELEIEPFPVDRISSGIERWISCHCRTRVPAPMRSRPVALTI